MCADKIKDRFLGGESVEDLARHYGMTKLEIENLVRFSFKNPDKRSRRSWDSPEGDY